MKKKALLALMLALTLALSGCALIKKDLAVDAATEIIRLGDQVVTKGEIQKEVNYQLNYMAYMYSMYGMSYDATSAENIASAQEAVIDNFKTTLVSKAKITELDLDKNLNEDEEARIKADAEADYQENLDYVISDKYADSELSEEEIQAKAAEDLKAKDYTMETAEKEAREKLLMEKLREYVVKDVTVSEEEIKADYDSKVEEDKSTYAENASSYCSAANNGTTLYYTPAGVRYVKQILIQYSEEHQTAISDAEAKVTAAQAILDDEEATEEAKTQAQADLDAAKAEVEALKDAAYASIDAEADDVLAQLAAGADWDTLMAEKTMDPGMQEGRATAITGYAVCKGMASFDSAFVEAAMALKNIGDVTGKVRGSSDGYYIIRYVGDATEGAVDYESVKADLESALLEQKKTTTYNETVKGWVDAASFKIDLNALKD